MLAAKRNEMLELLTDSKVGREIAMEDRKVIITLQ